MKHIHRTVLLGAITFLGTTAGTFAQTKKAPTQTHIIKIKNALSSVIAYQIAPAHNARPAALGAVNEAEPKGAITLPGDIKQIVAIEAQTLSIEGGSDEDIRRLRELVDVLDQPMRQIEIEAQIVEIKAEDARTFGFDLSQTPEEQQGRDAGKFVLKAATVRNNFTARLNALIADNRAKIIAAPRATVANNFSVELPIQTNRFIPLTTAIGGAGQVDSHILSNVSLKAVPIINGDGTITLDIEIDRKLTVLSKIYSRVAGQAIVNVRDGDTIVLGNLSLLLSAGVDVQRLGDITFINALFRSKTPDYSQQTLIFLTPRIVRREAGNASKP